MSIDKLTAQAEPNPKPSGIGVSEQGLGLHANCPARAAEIAATTRNTRGGEANDFKSLLEFRLQYPDFGSLIKNLL